MAEPLRIALAGLGTVGAGVIRLLDTNAALLRARAGRELQVVAVSARDRDKDRGVDLARFDWHDDMTQMAARDDVDVVIGTLPHWLHFQAGLDAANAGKHVFMEKPLALSATEGRQMLDAAAANGVKLMTAHTQRYYPAVKAMKELVDSKRLGDVVMAHDMWHKPYQPETRPTWMLDGSKGGGMGQMDGTHEIDRLMWIMGDDVATVSAQIGQVTYPRAENPEIDCDDTAMCFLRWQSGKVATISRMAWQVGATEYGADFFFTKGMARFRLKYGRAEGQDETNSLLDEFTDFVQAIERGDEDTPIPQEHGLRVLKVFEATEASARTGREVDIDW